MTEPLNAVFVYGTLKPGCRNAGWASAIAAPQADPAVLHGYALHHLGRYPAAAPASDAAPVQGVLYRYPPGSMPAVLAQLDELEGFYGPRCPENLYERVAAHVEQGGCPEVPAWLYVYARPLPPGRRIESGSWRDDLWPNDLAG